MRHQMKLAALLLASTSMFAVTQAQAGILRHAAGKRLRPRGEFRRVENRVADQPEVLAANYRPACRCQASSSSSRNAR